MRADLTQRARNLSLSAFTLLAEAEGRIHGVPAEEVHFHEVGADRCHRRYRLLRRSGGCPGSGRVVLLPGECREWFCQLRPRTLSGTRPGDRGVAQEPADLFRARAGRTGHPDRRGFAARAGLPVRCHPGDADPGDRLRSRDAEPGALPQRPAGEHRRDRAGAAVQRGQGNGAGVCRGRFKSPGPGPHRAVGIGAGRAGRDECAGDHEEGTIGNTAHRALQARRCGRSAAVDLPRNDHAGYPGAGGESRHLGPGDHAGGDGVWRDSYQDRFLAGRRMERGAGV